MSVAREVQAVDYDLQVLADAARDMGFIVKKNTVAYGWGRSVMQNNCDLVLTNPKNVYGLDIGFKRQPDGKVTMYADNHGEGAQNDLAQTILPRYIERMLQKDHRSRLGITGRAQVGKVVTLSIGRM